VVLRAFAERGTNSQGKQDRKRRAQTLERLLRSAMLRETELTTDAVLANKLSLPYAAIDISITRLERVVRGPWMELQCELRVTVSDRKGKMISFLTGGAKVQVATAHYQQRFDFAMRKEAIEGAVKRVHGDLVRYLSRRSRV